MNDGFGLKRLQRLVLWVSNVDRSVRLYQDVVGLEVKRKYPNAAFMKIPGSEDDHNLGIFEQPGAGKPDERVARMYHSAWEVGEIADLARARTRLIQAGALVGQSDHGVRLPLYAKDPARPEFEIFWTLPGGASVGASAPDPAAGRPRRSHPDL